MDYGYGMAAACWLPFAITQTTTAGRRAMHVPVDALPAPPRPRRVAALDHKVADDSMEQGAVVVATPGQLREVVARPRCMGGVQLQLHAPHAGLERDVLRLGRHHDRR